MLKKKKITCITPCLTFEALEALGVPDFVPAGPLGSDGDVAVVKLSPAVLALTTAATITVAAGVDDGERRFRRRRRRRDA